VGPTIKSHVFHFGKLLLFYFDFKFASSSPLSIYYLIYLTVATTNFKNEKASTKQSYTPFEAIHEIRLEAKLANSACRKQLFTCSQSIHTFFQFKCICT